MTASKFFLRNPDRAYPPPAALPPATSAACGSAASGRRAATYLNLCSRAVSIHAVRDDCADVIEHVDGVQFAIHQCLDIRDRKTGSCRRLLHRALLLHHQKSFPVEEHLVLLVVAGGELKKGQRTRAGSPIPGRSRESCHAAPFSCFNLRSKLQSLRDKF